MWSVFYTCSQFEEIPEEEWPNPDNPRKAAEVGESSKSAGKESDQPTPQAKTQTEGGATAPPADDPPQPSQYPCRIPPINPKIPKQVLAQMTQVSRSM